MKPSEPAFDKWWGDDRDLPLVVKSALSEAFSAGFTAGLQHALELIQDTFPEDTNETAG
jgi:hypothetical protein